jgi:hypothetical protein
MKEGKKMDEWKILSDTINLNGAISIPNVKKFRSSLLQLQVKRKSNGKLFLHM